MTDTPEAHRGGQALPAPAHQVGAAGRRRLQLDRNASRPSCRARSACGSTASASRRRSRIRPSRASSARSATASCRRGRRRRLRRTFGDGIGVAGRQQEARRRPTSTASGRLASRWAARLLQAGGGVPFRNVDPTTTRRCRKGVKMPAAWIDAVVESRKIGSSGLPVDRAGDRVPRHLRHRADQHDRRRRPGDRAEEGDRAVQADPREEREGLSARPRAIGRDRDGGTERRRVPLAPHRGGSPAAPAATCCSSLPALVVIAGGHRLPLGLHDLDEHARLDGRRRARPSSASPTTRRSPAIARFLEAIGHTLLLHRPGGGRCRWCWAPSRRCVFHREFPLRGSCAASSSCR